MSLTARRGLATAASPAHVLAFRLRAQRLEQRTAEPLLDVARDVGFVSTPGGATPYLALRARSPRFDRRLVERVVFESGELVDLPFARGTSVLAPASDAGAVLAAARPGHELKVAPLVKAGLLDDRKLARLAESILTALASGPLAADDLRARLPEALCVPLGEPGRKAGFASLFTVALRSLLLDGRVLRRPREARLDRESFVYALSPRPPAPLERGTALAILAGRYFRAYPASPASAFAYWADASVGEAREAISEAGLVAVPVEGAKEPGHLATEDLDEFQAFEPPTPARLAFVPFRDPAVSGGKDLKGMMHEAHRALALADWRGRLVPSGGGAVVHQHLVLHGGFVAGVWEFDEGSRQVSYATFDPLPTRMRRAADDAAEELASYIADHLGAARFYADERADGWGRLEEVTGAWRESGTR